MSGRLPVYFDESKREMVALRATDYNTDWLKLFAEDLPISHDFLNAQVDAYAGTRLGDYLKSVLPRYTNTLSLVQSPNPLVPSTGFTPAEVVKALVEVDNKVIDADRRLREIENFKTLAGNQLDALPGQLAALSANQQAVTTLVLKMLAEFKIQMMKDYTERLRALKAVGDLDKELARMEHDLTVHEQAHAAQNKPA